MVLVSVFVIVDAFYYHFKHLLIPDVEDGILKSIRLYNLLGVINCVVALVSIICMQSNLPYLGFLLSLVTFTPISVVIFKKRKKMKVQS